MYTSGSSLEWRSKTLCQTAKMGLQIFSKEDDVNAILLPSIKFSFISKQSNISL